MRVIIVMDLECYPTSVSWKTFHETCSFLAIRYEVITTIVISDNYNDYQDHLIDKSFDVTCEFVTK